MFGKKYIFETKRTAIVRRLLNFSLLAILVTAGYLVFCTYLVLQGDEETKKSESSLFNRPPDLIVVFTGDKGRINFALEKAREYGQSHIFVSGVNERNTIHSLFPTNSSIGALDSNLFDLDYASRNTFENVINTLNYIDKNKGLKRVLIISHDYHIPRIKMVMDYLVSGQKSIEAPNYFYWGIKSDSSNWRNIKIIFKESIKIFRTMALLLFWEGKNS